MTTAALAVARFAGWFQPWVVALIIGLPSLLLLAYRMPDIRRRIEARDWKRRAGSDDAG